MLRRNNHHSLKLQRAWNKYGEDAFDFDLLEFGLYENEVRGAEKYWIDKLDSFHNGYNMTDYVGQGTTMPDSQKRKMAVAAQEVGTRTEIRLGRSERARLQHAFGKFVYRARTVQKFKYCKECGVQFALVRNHKAKAWRENKLCEVCRGKCRFSTRK